MQRRLIALILSVGALCAAQSAYALVTCSVSSTGVAFGVYNPLAAVALDSNSGIRLTCTLSSPPSSQQVSYSMQLSTGASGSYAGRFMQSGAAQLNYSLYRNSARTQIWGDGSAGTVAVNANITLGPSAARRTRSVTKTVFGRIAAAQDVAAGAYSDTIVVTVVF